MDSKEVLPEDIWPFSSRKFIYYWRFLQKKSKCISFFSSKSEQSLVKGEMDGSADAKVLSSFLWALLRALNLHSQAKAPLGLLPKKYVSFLCVCFFCGAPLKLVNKTMSKEVRDKVAGPLSLLFICCVKDWEITPFLRGKRGIWSSTSWG